MPDRLTPVDILNIRFPRRFRGYAVADVDDFVRRAASDMETLLAECASQKERIAALEREIGQFRALENTMRDALVMAQKAADETRAAAQAQANAQMQEAQNRLSDVNNQIERLQQERRRFARELHARLTTQLAWLAEELESEPVPAPLRSPLTSLPTVSSLPAAVSENKKTEALIASSPPTIPSAVSFPTASMPNPTASLANGTGETPSGDTL